MDTGRRGKGQKGTKKNDEKSGKPLNRCVTCFGQRTRNQENNRELTSLFHTHTSPSSPSLPLYKAFLLLSSYSLRGMPILTHKNDEENDRNPNQPCSPPNTDLGVRRSASVLCCFSCMNHATENRAMPMTCLARMRKKWGGGVTNSDESMRGVRLV